MMTSMQVFIGWPISITTWHLVDVLASIITATLFAYISFHHFKHFINNVHCWTAGIIGWATILFSVSIVMSISPFLFGTDLSITWVAAVANVVGYIYMVFAFILLYMACPAIIFHFRVCPACVVNSKCPISLIHVVFSILTLAIITILSYAIAAHPGLALRGSSFGYYYFGTYSHATFWVSTCILLLRILCCLFIVGLSLVKFKNIPLVLFTAMAFSISMLKLVVMLVINLMAHNNHPASGILHLVVAILGVGANCIFIVCMLQSIQNKFSFIYLPQLDRLQVVYAKLFGGN